MTRKKPTPKQKVLKKYPVAYAEEITFLNGWVIFDGVIGCISKVGYSTPALAWAAAERMTKEK